MARVLKVVIMTTTTVSSKGQVVLPKLIRNRLHLRQGARLICRVEGNSVVLTPEQPVAPVREYTTDPITGLRVRRAVEGAEPVTAEMVKSLLEDYP
jgi:AbrB family looped-hinge helix DNA binding protein